MLVPVPIEITVLGSLPAQTILLVHFWGTGILALALLLVGILQLRDAGGQTAAASLPALAAKFPLDFIELARSVGVDSTPNTGAVSNAQVCKDCGYAFWCHWLVILCLYASQPAPPQTTPLLNT